MNIFLLVRLYVFANVELNSLNVERLFHNKNMCIYLCYSDEYSNIVIYYYSDDDVANCRMKLDWCCCYCSWQCWSMVWEWWMLEEDRRLMPIVDDRENLNV